MAIVRRPFHTLREAGLQADIRDAVCRRLSSAEVLIDLNQRENSPLAFDWVAGQRSSRLQLEMKVSSRAKTDVVVLRRDAKVSLTCHDGGPGDVVASVRARDVLAAIEVKASPSRRDDEQARYARDLRKLLTLSDAHAISTFFVLADKSIELYGKAETGISTLDWDLLGRRHDLKVWRSANGRLTLDCPFVEAWDLELRNGRWSPRRVYVTARDSRRGTR